MLNQLFLGMSLIGAEWVLYLLILLSVISVSLMIERIRFYQKATRGLAQFRSSIRQAAAAGKWDDALKTAQARKQGAQVGALDMETELAQTLITHRGGTTSSDVLSEAAQDSVIRARLEWERNLAVLATIGNNAPFIGLFGTVLGIIKAFHDLSQQAGMGVQTVTAGISEALIATAIGILVAIPAVVAFNVFSRRVKAGLAEAEALKSFLIGQIAGKQAR